MTVTAHRLALSDREGWTYKPEVLATQDFLTESGRQYLKHQATKKFYRKAKAHHLDPVANALVIDAILRLEHRNEIGAAALTDFLNAEYPQFSWSVIIVGRILANLGEAALSAPLPESDRPITVTKKSDRFYYRFNTSPRSWRWLLSMRTKIGEQAEASLAREAIEERPKTYWPDFPWEVAEQMG